MIRRLKIQLLEVLAIAVRLRGLLLRCCALLMPDSLLWQCRLQPPRQMRYQGTDIQGFSGTKRNQNTPSVCRGTPSVCRRTPSVWESQGIPGNSQKRAVFEPGIPDSRPREFPLWEFQITTYSTVQYTVCMYSSIGSIVQGGVRLALGTWHIHPESTCPERAESKAKGAHSY